LEAEGTRWRVLKLPAIAGMDDPLGRAPGEPLWADDGYGYGASLARVRATYEAGGAMRDWASLYQQEPRPAAGGLFKAALVAALDTAPAEAAGARMVRAWDLAATGAAGTRDPDWTVGVLLMRTSDRRLIVLDVARLRGGPEEVERAILATAGRDGRRVKVALPQDPGQAGKAQVAYLTRRLMGWTVLARPETGTGAKATRAAPVASQCNAGKPRRGAGGVEPRLPRGAGRLPLRRARRPGGRAGAGVRRAGRAVLRHLDALGRGR
jgi:predicted phage terminase large subunit-like protein